MKRIAFILCMLSAVAYGADVHLGPISGLTWTGSGSARVATWAGGAIPVPDGFLPVDMLIDFEAGNIGDLISTQSLNSSTRSARPLGYWVVRYGNETNAPDVPAFPSNLTIGASSAGFIVPVSVSTSSYFSTGTRGHKAQMSNAYHNSRFVFSGPGHTNLSVGLWFTAPYGPNGESKDVINVKKGAGYSILNCTQGVEFAYATMHTGSGKSPGIQITPGERYWASMYLPITNGIDTLVIYDASGVLVGTNTLTQPNVTSLHDQWWVGRSDDTGNKMDSTVTVDNIMFDMEDASFPLGISTNVAQHSTPQVDGMLMAENFEANKMPLGFNASGSGITWASNVVGMEALSALAITNTSGDVWYDLCANYSNIFTYSMVKHEAVANYRYITKFSSPLGTYADLMGVQFNYQTKPYIYGATGGSYVSPTVSSNGIVYHVWTEWYSGSSSRVFIATSPTKPATPTMFGPIGGATYTNTTVRYIHLNDAGKSYHDKWRISTNVIGSNPL